MHPSKVIKDPKINDTYYDPDVDKLYQYVKIGDFPPEWVVTNIDEDELRFDGILVLISIIKFNKFVSLKFCVRKIKETI